jgi:PIN domain nuclease of toxin-antitoxin system
VSLLLLDTHVWIWSAENTAGRVGRRTLRLIAKAASAGWLRVSAISVFEVAALYHTGRLGLGRPAEQWVRQVLEPGGIAVAELSAATALDAGGLPHAALPDPLDRFLVATARQLDATFVTCDRRILAYAAATRNLRVHDGAS